jgi:hypothetical protein
MKEIIPQYIDQRLNMPWPMVCQTACQAMIRKVSFETVVEAAMVAQMKGMR